jgi:hypothetical protein
MATYSSYKQIASEEIQNNTITDANFAPDALKNFGVQWIFGSPGECTPGCCCLWTVPTDVSRTVFEIWSAGGNGHGACSCDRCHHYRGAMGGLYNNKTISVCPGWQYTVCAGGVYRCYSIECTACNGCSSYVVGCNLSNFCACGGDTGRAETSWNTYCYSDWNYCISPTQNGGDFNVEPMRPAWSGANVFCHCHNQEAIPGTAPFIGTTVYQQLRECWMRCGCWTVPYGHGGMGAMTTYCGSSCCGQGGTGGSGLVKITYI